MKLRCQNIGKNKSISRNREYDVVEELDNRYAIVNDNGVQKNYAKSLFEVIPEVPVVPVIDELNITTTITVTENNNISFVVDCPFINRLSINYRSGNIMAWAGTNISCGIYQINGIDSLLNHLRILRTSFDEFLLAHSNDFTLNPDINLDETFKDIYESLLQDLIAEFQTPNRRCGILIMSTTTRSVETLPDFHTALNEIADSVVITTNPNSPNEIKLWSIKTEPLVE